MSQVSTELNKKIMIVVGESSGDLHGSNLLRAAGEAYPHLKFFGVGGERMRSAGCRIVFPSDELSVMGLVEVFAQLPSLIARFRQLKKILHGPERPDLLVLIDFPDFNLRLAKVAKQVGVPVLYYISPKVWAWRSGRAKVIAERVDRMALIFPFEPQIYHSFGVSAEYVGNPLLDEFAANQPSKTLRSRLCIGEKEQVVGIFPGSRNSELKYIFATLLETARQLQLRKPDIKFLLPVAPSLSKQYFVEQLRDRNLPIEIVEENIYETAAACDAVLSVSGTVTLQITLVKTPLAIVYKMAPLSFAIGRRLIKVAYAGLTNIIAGKEVAREFIQDDASPEALSDEIIRLLDDQDYRQKMQQELTAVGEQMGAPGCSVKVARIIAEMTAATS
ncbi:lipid-A-disaccharide synthase [Malonomonas rubra]|uniref:lipid-A-disaccharide synthase n=1 Tax=Malonomonas rubra TaxID=57040 RepID=UPI0026EBB5FF|nr:lipid-A-disaccharide synthase [Malonomonas rubra]